MNQSPPSTAVAERIRAVMAEKGISQETVGAALGISQEAVSRRVRGVVDWRASELVALAPMLDVPISDLLGQPTERAS